MNLYKNKAVWQNYRAENPLPRIRVTLSPPQRGCCSRRVFFQGAVKVCRLERGRMKRPNSAVTPRPVSSPQRPLRAPACVRRAHATAGQREAGPRRCHPSPDITATPRAAPLRKKPSHLFQISPPDLKLSARCHRLPPPAPDADSGHLGRTRRRPRGGRDGPCPAPGPRLPAAKATAPV